MSVSEAPAPPRVARRVLVAIVLGAVLSPLNSGMIATALVPVRDAFDVGVIALSWLISSFYVVAAVGQSVLGRLADQFGPRRLLCVGFALAGLGGLVGPLAPSFGWLLAARLLIGCGTAATVPAGFALLRNASGGRPPASGVLARLNAGVLAAAAISPVLGGGLVTLVGWEAIFLLDVVLGAIGIPLALRWLPADAQHAGGVTLPLARRLIDVPGILAFAVMLGSFLALLLSLGESDPRWWLAPLVPLAATGLVLQSLRREEPFLELRVLAENRALLGICIGFLLINVVAFGVLFSVSLWLGAARGYDAFEIGLLTAPLGGVAVLMLPLAARAVVRLGWRPVLAIGVVAMLSGTLMLTTLEGDTVAPAILAALAVFGLPISFNNLALQTGLYQVTEAERTGAAAGLMQTSRFVGAVLATSAFGLMFADGVTDARLHSAALGLAAVSGVVLTGTLVLTRR